MMLTVVLTDDTGRTIVSGPQTTSGHFIAPPMPIVVTDATGHAAGAFLADPISAKQVDENGFNSTFFAHPIAAVTCDARGYSTGSGKFVGQPLAVVLV